MIAPEVAYDKLAAFQSADEIADFLEAECVQAVPCQSEVCAISVWMRRLTGRLVSTGTHDMEVVIPWVIKPTGFVLTPAMSEFVSKFDQGRYPSLIVDDFVDD